jgi:diaminopimelate decarboxylase
LLERIAAKVGTPFWLYDAPILRKRIQEIRDLTAGEGLQARYAMKACPNHFVLGEMLTAGIWIDAVSANECLRALRAGFPGGSTPPAILYTADVFRDGGIDVVRQHQLVPNVGSPGMIRDLNRAGYRGPIGIRVNPGFGHGHVNACDTGGPSSKHGIWIDDLAALRDSARHAGLAITLLHAHVGSGPRQEELRENFHRLAHVFAGLLPQFPEAQAISLGGGLPYDYREHRPLDLAALRAILLEARSTLDKAASRAVRLEIEPGRYYVADSATLVTRVTDIKSTRGNDKGAGATFAMVDAGFVDLVRPAMYGSFHRISVPARAGQPTRPIVVAGPLCESGDVFTRDSEELLAPRELPLPEPGDLLCLHDAGAYGYAMSSQYNSIGRAPQVCLETDRSLHLISRRETLEDILRAEVSNPVL